MKSGFGKPFQVTCVLLTEILSGTDFPNESGWLSLNGKLTLHTDHWTGARELVPECRDVTGDDEDDLSDQFETILEIMKKHGYIGFFVEDSTMWIRARWDRLNHEQAQAAMRFALKRKLGIKEDF